MPGDQTRAPAFSCESIFHSLIVCVCRRRSRGPHYVKISRLLESDRVLHQHVRTACGDRSFCLPWLQLIQSTMAIVSHILFSLFFDVFSSSGPTEMWNCTFTSAAGQWNVQSVYGPRYQLNGWNALVTFNADAVAPTRHMQKRHFQFAWMHFLCARWFEWTFAYCDRNVS